MAGIVVTLSHYGAKPEVVGNMPTGVTVTLERWGLVRERRPHARLEMGMYEALLLHAELGRILGLEGGRHGG